MKLIKVSGVEYSFNKCKLISVGLDPGMPSSLMIHLAGLGSQVDIEFDSEEASSAAYHSICKQYNGMAPSKKMDEDEDEEEEGEGA